MKTYRHICTFRQDSSAAGSQEADYSTVALKDVPCNVRDVTGGEVVRGRQMEATTTHLIETRYYDAIYNCEPAKMRIDFEGLEMHVSRILRDETRRDFLLIQASSVASDG